MKRKRIRDIDQNYHCSIIGTCLTHKEVREILESSYKRDFSQYADHDLHSMAVGGARELSRLSNRLTERLNKKYYAEIFQASHTLSTVDLEKYWCNSFSEGNISGPYWAVLSHSMCTDSSINLAYGDVHMLSHLAANEERSRRENLAKKENLIRKLQDDNKDLKNKSFCSEEQARAFQKDKIELEIQNKILHKEAQCSTGTFRDKAEKPEIKEIEKVHKKLKLLEKRYGFLEERLKDLKGELESFQEYHRALKNLRIEASDSEKKEFYGTSCVRMAKGLDRKRILLVGGRQSMVPHCRSVVELMNGKFYYHDGGKEQSRVALQSQAVAADIIICALDCVSHDASRCVKRICREGKQKLIMLKNSGVSTFTRELKMQFNNYYNYLGGSYDWYYLGINFREHRKSCDYYCRTIRRFGTYSCSESRLRDFGEVRYFTTGFFNLGIWRSPG